MKILLSIFLLPLLINTLQAKETKQHNLFSAEQVASFPITIDFSDSTGGIIAADLDKNDPNMELIITTKGHIAAYRIDGSLLWKKEIDICVSGSAENEGLPGHHAAGVQSADIDDDGNEEVLFLDKSNILYIINGKDGTELFKIILPPPPSDAEKWEHLAICNFRGKGEKDLLLQATNAKDYRMGKYLAAYPIEELIKGEKKELWQVDNFIAAAHSGARIADLDQDGKDEVLGGTIIDHTGKIQVQLEIEGHVDGVYAGDIRPDLKGLEVVILEEGKNRIFLLNSTSVIWQTHHNHQEPHNAIIGRFLTNSQAMQIWCRSRYDEHQQPFVFDEFGKLLTQYKMDDVAIKGWTVKGVEVIHAIYWDGTEKMYGCAKERHKAGDICIFDPITGNFLLTIKENAERLYVADVLGDWREEIIVGRVGRINIYANSQPNPNPNKERLWKMRHYKQSKTIWNYYCP